MRYLPLTVGDRADMLAAIGVDSIDALFADVPEAARLNGLVDLPRAMGQTQVALLTGMEVANASLYDGATACAEAVMMANRVTGRRKAVLSGGLHPHYREICDTYARFVGFELSTENPARSENLAGLVDQD